MTRFWSSDIGPPHGHMTTFWALCNQPALILICNVLQSHDHDLWCFCQKWHSFLPYSKQRVCLMTAAFTLPLWCSLYDCSICGIATTKKVIKWGLVIWSSALQPSQPTTLIARLSYNHKLRTTSMQDWWLCLCLLSCILCVFTILNFYISPQ